MKTFNNKIFKALISCIGLSMLGFIGSAQATVIVDATWTSTSQVNVTPFSVYNNIVAGINFVNNSVSSPGTSTLLGVAFDDVNVHPGTGATYDFTNNMGGGSFSLTANGQGPTLETRFGFLHDRHDNGGAVSGADATVANFVLKDIHTICHVRTDDCHEQEMTVGNLTPNTIVYLQFFGGDQGWNSQLSMSVNGAVVGTWTTVTSNPSTFGFKTTTNSAGELDIDINIVSGDFAGVSAFFVIEESQDSDGDGLSDTIDPDDDNDTIADLADNCPLVANIFQEDDDFDGLGNACDTIYDAGSVAQHVDDEAVAIVNILTALNVSGGNGIISKLTGNGSVTQKVANAVINFGVTGNLESYLSDLASALNQLNAAAQQVTAKANKPKGISDPELGQIYAGIDDMRSTIEGLILAAGGTP